MKITPLAFTTVVALWLGVAVEGRLSEGVTTPDAPDSDADRELLLVERNNHEREVAESRIVGGSAADRNEYLYFVSWGGCAASLISENTVLTAAHCNVIGTNNVIVGAYQKWWGQTSGQAERRRIVERIPHPEYNPSTFENDYMVMKLDRAVTHIDPVALNSAEEIPVDGSTVTAIGFGAVFEGGWGPRLLQEVDVDAVSHEQCNDEYDGDIVQDLMLCAGVDGGGKDSCQGDSGGPLVRKLPDGTHEQVGVVSWGFGCARAEYSGVYSRVSGQIDWINRQVCVLEGQCSRDDGSTANTDPPPTNCADSTTRTFLIDDVEGEQNCAWLGDNMERFDYLCRFVDVATACPDLCGVCDMLGLEDPF